MNIMYELGALEQMDYHDDLRAKRRTHSMEHRFGGVSYNRHRSPVFSGNGNDERISEGSLNDGLRTRKDL